MQGTSRRTVLGYGLGGIAFGTLLPSIQSMADTTGTTDSDITLGVCAAFSGASRSLGIELYRGARAYFNHTNENGGIRGRSIQLKCYDDGYQPTPSVLNTLKLIQEDQVFALFGYVGTPTVTRVLPLLKKFQDKQAYMFFPFTGAQPQREPPYGDFAFNLRASYRQETEGLVDNFMRIGRRRIAVFYQADAYGRSGWAGVRKALTKYDSQIVGEATYRRGAKFTGSMRAQVEILKEADPDAIICIGSYAACAAFLRDAVNLGLSVPTANLSFVGSENLLKLVSEGQADKEKYTRLLVNSQVVPSYEDLSIAAVREYRELMATYNPDPPADLVTEDYATVLHSFVSLEGFLNAKLMVEILNRLGDQPDRTNIVDAVYSITDFDLGIDELVSFGPNRRQGLQRVYYTVVDGDRYISLDSWEARFGG